MKRPVAIKGCEVGRAGLLKRGCRMSDQAVGDYTIDKSQWPDGPWKDEPDRKEWRHLGLPCLMVRQKNHGAWCGYVAVPPGHPLHGVHYDECDVSVHGGLTYSDKCHGRVCHVPAPGEPDDVWWLGFDCAHCGDRTPAADLSPEWYDFGSTDLRDVYRTASWVEAEVNRLAGQILAAARQPG